MHDLHRLKFAESLALGLLHLPQVQQDVISLLKHLLEAALVLQLAGYFILGAEVALLTDTDWPFYI